MVQADKLDLAAVRRNLCIGKLGDGHAGSASIPLRLEAVHQCLVSNEDCPGGQSCITVPLLRFPTGGFTQGATP